jgi:hypothetical protein
MTTDDLMVDVSKDWLQACDLQESFAGGVVDVDLSICCVFESRPLRSGHIIYNRRKCGREVVTIAPGEGEPLCHSFAI